jgi:hypothetical protein
MLPDSAQLAISAQMKDIIPWWQERVFYAMLWAARATRQLANAYPVTLATSSSITSVMHVKPSTAILARRA